MLRTIAISTLLLACASGVAHADVYRWVDEHGSVHYSDQWVPGSELIKTTKPRPVNSNADSIRRTTEQHKLVSAGQHASEQLSQESAAQAVKQDVAKIREQQCKEAKERYEKAIQARRIFTTTKDGGREYVSDEEADKYRVKARTDVQEACGTAPK